MVNVISAGTVTFTNGSKTVTLSGATWTLINPGDLIDSPVGARLIASQTDGTHLQLATNYPGTTAPGVPYAIIPASDRWGSNLTISQRLVALYDAITATAAFDAIGALAPAADKGLYFTGSGTAALTDFTAKGRSLVGAATEAAQRALIGADTRPILIFAAGQSNMSRYEALVWDPPANLSIWNRDAMNGAATAVGTAFAAADPNKVSVSWSFAAEVARANPLRRVYLVNASTGGQPISKWLTGSPVPDMYATGKSNVEAALAAIGVPVQLIHLWWQGEADVLNANYYNDFFSYRIRLIGETWYPRETPMIVFGVTPHKTDSTATSYKEFNKVLMRCVAREPDRLIFVYPGVFPNTFWDPSVDYLHMTAQGDDAAGRLAYWNMFGGTGRKVLPGIVVDPYTLQLLTPDRVAFSASMTADLSSAGVITTYNTPDINVGSAFNAATGVFTAPVGGLYVIDYSIYVGSTGACTVRLQKNGAAGIKGANLLGSGASTTWRASLPMMLNSGDTIKRELVSGSIGATLDRFSGYLLG